MKGVAYRPGNPDLVLRDVVNAMPAFVDVEGPVSELTEVEIRHGLGRKPIGATVIKHSETLTSGQAMGLTFSSEPTDINLYIKFSVAVTDGNTVTLAVW